jgi:hypothetical protein
MAGNDPNLNAETVLRAEVYSESVHKLAPDTVLLKRYRLQRLLGKGGMGVVWLAHDLELKEDVALKFLPDMVAGDKAALEELKVEVRRSRRVTHPNIVRIHDYLQDADWACISMEYVDGDTLSNLRVLRPSHVFDPGELGPWVRQLCAALDYAHAEAKMVHHDLKPANCMITAQGKLKLCDFGIARSLSESLTRLTTRERTSGTLIYMSPQHLMGDDPSAADDVYSLGATLYELLTSKPPFYSGNIAAQVMEKVPPTITERRQALGIEAAPIPREWEKTVAACLAKDVADRPRSTREVAERLGLETASPQAPAETRVAEKSKIPAPPPVRRTGRPLLLAGTVAGLLLLALAGWYLGIHPPAGRARQAEIARLEEQRRTAEFQAKAAQSAAEKLRLENEAKQAAEAAEKLRTEREKAERERQAAEEAQRREAERVAGLRGGLMVKTVPEGAAVALGGEEVQKSPATFKGLKVGKCKLQIMLEGYEPVEKQVEVKPNEFADEGTIALTRSRGTLQLSSEPAGAAYELKGPEGPARQGKTPETLKDLPTGNYEVLLRHDGWEMKQTVTVQRNDTTTHASEFAFGRVTITSEPAGAQVFCGSKSLGKTPATVELLQGQQEVTARLGDWAEMKKTVLVKKQETEQADFKFDVGHVSITAEPAGAAIRIDGKEMGKAPVSNLVLPVGAHKLEASAPEHQGSSLTFQVKYGGKDTVSIVLKNPSHEAWKKVAGKYQGTLKAIDGRKAGGTGSFEMTVGGTRSSPIVTYVKDNTKIYILGGTHTASNDPKVKSRYPITASFSAEGALTITGKDFFSIFPVTHNYTIKFEKPGEASVNALIGVGDPGGGWTETGVLKKVDE